MDALQQRLKQMQSNMKQQMEDYTPGGGSFEPIPDGIYQAAVKPTMLLSKSGKVMVAWTFVISEGDLSGRKIFDNTVLEGNEGPGSIHKVGSHICRQRVEALGHDWPEDNLVMLRMTIDTIDRQAPVVGLDVRQKPGDGKYTNYTVYFVKEDSSVVAADGQPETDAAPETTAAPADSGRPLLDFCTRHDINGITDDMDDDTIIQSFIASDFKFNVGELEAEEVELLKSYTDGEQLIIEPEPPKPKAVLSRGKVAPAVASVKAKGKR